MRGGSLRAASAGRRTRAGPEYRFAAAASIRDSADLSCRSGSYRAGAFRVEVRPVSRRRYLWQRHGPDLSRTRLVADDLRGDKIGPFVKTGRVDKGMPAFDLNDEDVAAIVAYIH